MVSRSGKPFEDEIRKSLIHFKKTHPEFYWERIHDFHSIGALVLQLRKLLPYIDKVTHYRFGLMRKFGGYLNFNIPKSPADFKAIYEGKPFYLECKSFKGGARTKVSYPFEYVKPHQMLRGLEIEKAGGYYFFLMNDRRKVRNFRCKCFTATEWKLLRNSHKKKGRKSIKIKVMYGEKKGFELERLKGGIWDLKKIFISPE